MMHTIKHNSSIVDHKWRGCGSLCHHMGDNNVQMVDHEQPHHISYTATDLSNQTHSFGS